VAKLVFENETRLIREKLTHFQICSHRRSHLAKVSRGPGGRVDKLKAGKYHVILARDHGKEHSLPS
jgi:hypothetical protein